MAPPPPLRPSAPPTSICRVSVAGGSALCLPEPQHLGTPPRASLGAGEVGFLSGRSRPLSGCQLRGPRPCSGPGGLTFWQLPGALVGRERAAPPARPPAAEEGGSQVLVSTGAGPACMPKFRFLLLAEVAQGHARSGGLGPLRGLTNLAVLSFGRDGAQSGAPLTAPGPGPRSAAEARGHAAPRKIRNISLAGDVSNLSGMISSCCSGKTLNSTHQRLVPGRVAGWRMHPFFLRVSSPHGSLGKARKGMPDRKQEIIVH